MGNGCSCSCFALPEVLVSRRSSRHALSPTADDRPSGRADVASRLGAVRHDPLLVVTALASVGAGVVHGAVAPEHTNWWASVVFFVSLAVFQVAWGAFVLLRRPATPVLLLGTGVNLGALVTWTVSRTSGMPIGPHQGSAEPAARADIIASGLGVLVAVGALALARGWRPQPLLRMRPVLSAGAGGLAVSALSLVALSGVSGHAHSVGEDHGHAANVQPAAAAVELTPEAATALCRRTAQVTSDANFAKAAAAANGKAAAITKAEKATKNQLKRALAKCDDAPAPAQTKKVVQATPHPDDGHGH